MNNNNPEQKYNLNRSLATTIVCSLEFILAAAFILVVRFKSDLLGPNFLVKDIWLPTVLIGMGIISLTHSLIMRSTSTLWISVVFFVCAINWALVNPHLGGLTYKQIYPIYIAIPAIASLISLPFSREKNKHLKSIIFFGAISAILLINSLGKVDMFIIIPIVVIVAAGFIMVNAITRKKGRWDDGDRPQRNTPIENTGDKSDKV